MCSSLCSYNERLLLDCIRRTFTTLGYDVVIHQDLSGAEMTRQHTLSSLEDHSPFDSLVVWIMSHGDEGIIFGSDAEPVRITSIIDGSLVSFDSSLV